MRRKSSPKFVRWAVQWTVSGDMYPDADEDDTLYWAVWEDVYRAVYWVVGKAVDEAVSNRPPHPNLDLFLGEIQQVKEQVQ